MGSKEEDDYFEKARQERQWRLRRLREEHCPDCEPLQNDRQYYRCTDGRTGLQYISYLGSPKYEHGSWRKRYKTGKTTEIDFTPLLEVFQKIDELDTSIVSRSSSNVHPIVHSGYPRVSDPCLEHDRKWTQTHQDNLGDSSHSSSASRQRRHVTNASPKIPINGRRPCVTQYGDSKEEEEEKKVNSYDGVSVVSDWKEMEEVFGCNTISDSLSVSTNYDFDAMSNNDIRGDTSSVCQTHVHSGKSNMSTEDNNGGITTKHVERLDSKDGGDDKISDEVIGHRAKDEKHKEAYREQRICDRSTDENNDVLTNEISERCKKRKKYRNRRHVEKEQDRPTEAFVDKQEIKLVDGLNVSPGQEIEIDSDDSEGMEFSCRSRGYNRDFCLSRKSVTGSEIIIRYQNVSNRSSNCPSPNRSHGQQKSRRTPKKLWKGKSSSAPVLRFAYIYEATRRDSVPIKSSSKICGTESPDDDSDEDSCVFKVDELKRALERMNLSSQR